MKNNRIFNGKFYHLIFNKIWRSHPKEHLKTYSNHQEYMILDQDWPRTVIFKFPQPKGWKTLFLSENFIYGFWRKSKWATLKIWVLPFRITRNFDNRPRIDQDTPVWSFFPTVDYEEKKTLCDLTANFSIWFLWKSDFATRKTNIWPVRITRNLWIWIRIDQEPSIWILLEMTYYEE